MSCCAGGCSCLIREGTGITVTGSGTPSNPWVISADAVDLQRSFTVKDTETVNLTLIGSGSVNDPLELRADVSLKLSQLVDVQDPQGGPSVGESPVWVGTGANGHWEFGTLPPAPAGAVNVANGITGVGSVQSPIKLATSGVWGSGRLAGLGSDTTIGLETYVDSQGAVRAQPVPAPTFAQVRDKPNTYPPSTHSHKASDISDPLELNVGKINGVRVFATLSSATAPAGMQAGDVWLFPKGS